jgi:hypothetical protein
MSGDKLAVIEHRFASCVHLRYLVKVGDCQSFMITRGELVDSLAALAHVALSASIKADRAHFAALTAVFA